MATAKEKVKNETVKTAIEAGKGKVEIVVREGKAEELREKKIIALSGVIDSPRLFWKNRHTEHNHHEEDKAHVIFSKSEMRIQLVLNENSHFAKTVTGKLQLNPELNAFKINNDSTFSIKELSDILKMRKFFFKDRTEATKIISNLQKFKATITSELEKADDRRGNTTDSMVTKVKSDLDTNFTLKMPVYKGQPEKEFKVDIEFDVTDGDEIEVYLISEGMRMIELESIDKIFEAELKPFRDDKVVCIEQ